MSKEYNPSITAIKRDNLSVPMRYLFSQHLLKGNIIDYACGYGDDVRVLQSMDFDIVGYDKYMPQFDNIETLTPFYQTVTCNYMFNVIKDWEEFYEAKYLLKELGLNVYVSVRADKKSIGPKWEYDYENEGWWTGRSFQRFYTPELVRDHFGNNVEILKVTNGYILFKM